MAAKKPLFPRLARFRESVRGIVEDLTTLEINTCVKDSMTGGKMPEPPHVLLDIAKEYAGWLADRGVPVGYFFHPNVRDLASLRSGPPAGPEQHAFEDDKLTNGSETFLRVRYAARYGRKLLEADENTRPDDLVLCDRIKGNCDQLKGLLQRLAQHHQDDDKFPATIGVTRQQLMFNGTARHPLRLDAQDRTTLRKIWELGCERVVMQSVVQLDGDVITRVVPDVARGKRAALVQIHEQSVGVALRTWTTLLDVVERLLGALGGRGGGDGA